MKTDTKSTSNEAENGNKSKPLLQAVFLFPYLAHKLTAKLSQQGIFNLDSEYPNENAYKIGYIEDFYFNDGEFSGSLKVTEKTSFDFEEGDIEIILKPISDINPESILLKHYFGKEKTGVLKDLQMIRDGKYDPLKCDYILITILISEHYDVFGLIKKCQAVSIHDVV